MTNEDMADRRRGFSLRRALPLLAALAGAAALFLLGRDYLDFETLRRHHEALSAWRDANYALTALGFVALYASVTALSFPGGAALTLTGGFLFGAVFGTVFSVSGATIGAIAIFLIVRMGLGEALRDRAGPFLKKAEAAFHENEISYLLVLRLVPAVPFFIANILPGFLGVPLTRYAWTTFIGIIPGGAVYAAMGAGLGEVFAAGETPDFGLIFAPHILGPLLGLAALAMLPVVVKWLRR